MSGRRVIVVGGGGSGIPLAARLGAHGDEVLLLEAGPSPDAEGPPRAAWTVRAGIPGSAWAWSYDAELFDGRPWQIGRGRVLGGSTAVNGGYFLRPHPDDFARWAVAAGQEWSFEACLPAMRRAETDTGGDPAWHGQDGPIPVTRSDGGPLGRAFLAAAESLGAARIDDLNADEGWGAGPLPRNVVGADRWGTADAYANLLRAAGVSVRTDTAVARVIIRGGRAVGVECGDGAVLLADEVVLCAGAIETPRLLVRSGIGPDGAVHPAPGVGQGLSDHPAIDLTWRARDDLDLRAQPAAWPVVWAAPPGALAEDAIELLPALKSREAIVDGDDRPTGELDLRITLTRPRSRGECLNIVRYRYLSDPRDLRALTDAVRGAVRLLRDASLDGLRATIDLPEWVDRAGAEQDAEQWLRNRLGTALHSCGTARMGAPDDPLAVADAHGRVYGVEALRLADASLLPDVPTRGAANAAVLIGERIAELMIQERGGFRGAEPVARLGG